MLNWREIPFVRLLLPFLFGLGLALSFDVYFSALPYFLLLLFIALLLLNIFKIPFQHRWIFGGLLQLFLIGFGYQLLSTHHELRHADHFQKHLEKENLLLVQIKDFPNPGKRIRVTAEVLAISSVETENQKWIPCSGQLLLYLDPQDENPYLHFGDQLLIRSKVNLIPASLNPEAFDYQAFQHFKNTHYQTFAKADQWNLQAKDQGNPWLSQAYQLRSKFLKILEKHLTTKAEYGVAASLILGYRSALTDDVRTAYTNTGATHVLAVSGLHVGFIYLGLAFIFNLFRFHHKAWQIIKTLLLIAGVWAFAFITGASPSVLRAATMFSFIIMGRTLNRHTNIYNTLAISAFFLLCFNPYLIAEVGFQLSYLAVLGIVSFQPWIYRSWIIDNPIGDYIWKLMSVSIAAQLATLPLTLFYFHQFPVYFWLSGLVVVPAAMFILSGGLLLFFLEMALPFLADLAGILLYWMVWMMNALIYLIQQLPAALLEGVWVNAPAMILLYLLLVALTIFFWMESKYRRLAIVWSACILLTATIWQSVIRWQQKQIVIYQVPRNSLVDVIDQRRALTFQSKELTANTIGFAAQNYRWKLGIKDQQIFNFDAEKIEGEHYFFTDDFFQFYHQRWAFLGKNSILKSEETLSLDYLLLRDTPPLEVAALQKTYPGATWLADASNAPWVVAKWQQECQLLGIPFINLAEQGAQIIKLKK